MVESLPADAGDTGSGPGLGRSHVPRSGWAREPRLLSLRVWSLCSPTREATIVRGPRTAVRSGPHLPQLGKALAQKRRPNIAINQSINQSIFKKKKKKRQKRRSKLYKDLRSGPNLAYSSHVQKKKLTSRKEVSSAASPQIL